jgi:predicted RNase H-like nuclease (RuvC/YqgF family)
MAKQLQADMAKLVESLDTFLEMRLQQEFDEMRDDIREVKKNEFGRKVFEAFLPEYRKHFVDATAAERELREAKEKINVLSKKYKNVRKDKDALVRKVKLEQVLSPLSGKSKDIMETILQSVATEELEEAYSKFINRVLKESNDSNKSTQTTISESATTTTVKSGVVKTGDTAVPVTESVSSTTTESTGLVLEFKKLAGIA